MTPQLKTCFKCHQELPLGGFYKHPQMSDGYLNKCKECTKQDVRANRADNLEYYRLYDRKRANLPKRCKSREDYKNSPAGKKSNSRSKKRYTDQNPERKRANYTLTNAVRDGRIEKPDACWCCGAEGRIHGHHSSYDFPLAVTWLCPKCHKAAHKASVPF